MARNLNWRVAFFRYIIYLSPLAAKFSHFISVSRFILSEKSKRPYQNLSIYFAKYTYSIYNPLGWTISSNWKIVFNVSVFLLVNSIAIRFIKILPILFSCQFQHSRILLFQWCASLKKIYQILFANIINFFFAQKTFGAGNFNWKTRVFWLVYSWKAKAPSIKRQFFHFSFSRKHNHDESNSFTKRSSKWLLI